LTSLPSRSRPLLALVRRDYAIERAYPLAFFFDIVFGLINLLIYFFISRTFHDVAPSDLQGAPSYFAFAAVGIAISLVVSAASSEVGNRLREEQLTGTIEALVTQPVSSAQIALGLAGFPFAFALVRALLYLVVAWAGLSLDLSRASWPGCILVLAASGLALLSVGIVLAAVVIVLKRGQGLVALTTTLLAFLGGAYFPLQVLPGWVEFIGKLLPTRFVFDGVRAALFTGSGWGEDALVLFGYSLIGLPIALFTFSAALAAAKRRGSLTQY
jgi:ABC-2 type transport system permease protein